MIVHAGMDEDFGQKSWVDKQSAKWSLTVTTNLDDFWFGKSIMIHQMFLPYGILML